MILVGTASVPSVLIVIPVPWSFTILGITSVSAKGVPFRVSLVNTVGVVPPSSDTKLPPFSLSAMIAFGVIVMVTKALSQFVVFVASHI